MALTAVLEIGDNGIKRYQKQLSLIARITCFRQVWPVVNG